LRAHRAEQPVGARKKPPSCRECGAVLDADVKLCPLCGANPEGDDWTAPGDVDDYQSNVRVLRDELKKLRQEGAEAV